MTEHHTEDDFLSEQMEPIAKNFVTYPARLRFVLRNGEKVLQECIPTHEFHHGVHYQTHYEWVDVPTVKEDEKSIRSSSIKKG